MAAGLLRPLDVRDAAAVSTADVPGLQDAAAGLQDVQLEPVLPSGELQLGDQDPVVADVGNLLGLHPVQAEPSLGGDHLRLPRVELLQGSEPAVTLVEPAPAVVHLGLDETLPVTTTPLVVDKFHGDQVGLPVLNYHGLVPNPAVEHGGLQPFAMLSSLQPPALNLQSSIWSKLGLL